MNQKTKQPKADSTAQEIQLPPGIYHRKNDNRFTVLVYTNPGGALYVGSYRNDQFLVALKQAKNALYHAHARLSRWIGNRSRSKFPIPSGSCPGTVLVREEMLLTGKIPDRMLVSESKLSAAKRRIAQLEAQLAEKH